MKRRGFTLTELLVVIGIIVVLLGLAGSMATRAWRNADRARTAADLAAIGTALEAYRQDFGDYPSVNAVNTGAPALAKALVGAGNATTPVAAFNGSLDYAVGAAVSQGQNEFVAIVNPPPPGGPGATPPHPSYWVQYNVRDGADGLGFVARQGGKKWPNYLDPERFKAGAGVSHGAALSDRYGRAYLYYPATGKPNVRLANGYIADWNYTAPSPRPMFNAQDNVLNLPLAAMRRMMGDVNGNGMIDGNESPAYEGPYILWGAGPDETFGPAVGVTNPVKAVEASDDVTNFRN